MYRHVALRPSGVITAHIARNTRCNSGLAALSTEQMTEFLSEDDERLLKKAVEDADRINETSRAILEVIRSMPAELRIANEPAKPKGIPPYTVFLRRDRMHVAEGAANKTAAHIENLKKHFRDQLREPRRKPSATSDAANMLYGGGLDDDVEGDTQESRKMQRDAAAAKAKDAAERYAQKVREFTGADAKQTAPAATPIERKENPFTRMIPARSAGNETSIEAGFKIRLESYGSVKAGHPAPVSQPVPDNIVAKNEVTAASVPSSGDVAPATQTPKAAGNPAASSAAPKSKPSSFMLAALEKLKRRQSG